MNGNRVLSVEIVEGTSSFTTFRASSIVQLYSTENDYKSVKIEVIEFGL